MKARIIAIAAAMVFLLYGSLSAAEVAAVAAVDMNRIQNEIGYQRIIFIETSAEVRTEILKLRTELDRTLIDCVKEQDEGKLAILQAKIQSINNKLNTIRNAMSGRNYDYRKSLVKYISGRYAGKYALIMDAQLIRSSGQAIILDASRINDLTDEIIQALERELP